MTHTEKISVILVSCVSSYIILLSGLITLLSRFVAAGSRLADAKEFMNVVNPPLLTYPDETLLVDIFNVPGLHCMTGIVGKLIGEVEKCFPDNKNTREGTAFVDNFLKRVNVHRAEYQGSHSFEGNHARKLLQVIGKMRPEAEKQSVEVKMRIMKIIDAFEAFNAVVESCFSKELAEDYEDTIKRFSKVYMELHRDYKVSVTVKVHLVMEHVVQQIQRKHPGYGIGVVTEQAFESAHHAFKLEWLKTKVDADHHDYAKRLFDAVVR